MTTLEAHITVAVALITAIGGPLTVKYIAKKIIDRRPRPKDPIATDLDINSLIDEQLEQIQEIFSADRAWISQFHNGGNFYPTGKSMQKFSVVYEHVTPGIKTMRDTYSNVPASLFSKSFKYLYEKDEIIAPIANESNLGLKSFADELDNKSSYIFALKSLHGDFLGTLGIEYCMHGKQLCETDLQTIRIKAAAIGSLLSTKLNIPFNKK